ncbi:uncharacterized protein LOC131313046 [Rhododendron vialii]|uniref:uncharacterized protein LOC131313046 n=1 Tax=Rhododendron vialii TaxID=182163 RepID=UPI00265F315D|nr:uncharacterized protein LOC131313046 [Rhododendron vialii]
MDCNITYANVHEWTFINDRQKGLIAVLNEEVPRAEHRHCAKHLLSNLQKRFKGVSVEDKFWACSKASHVPMFQDAMERMKEVSKEAYDWLSEESPRYWTRSHFNDTVKCDMVCNNLCEAFKNSILEAREKPIIEMLEWVRCYFSNRMLIRREWIQKFSNELLSNPYAKLEESLHESSAKKDKPERYIHHWCSKISYINAYQPLVNPTNGYKMWPKTEFSPVLPPTDRRKQGRPKKKRILGAKKYINPKYPHKLRKIGQNSIFWSKCGQHSHNRRTCTAPMAEESGDTSRATTIVATSVDVGVGRGGVQGRGERSGV